MTAPALSWGLFGRGAHEAGRPRVPEQGGPEQVPGDEPGPLLTAVAPATEEPVVDLPVPAPREPAGPAERALLEASRELGALHPLDRAESAAYDVLPDTAAADDPPVADLPAAPLTEQAAVDPEPAEVPWALPPVLDVLPSGGDGRRRTARDAVLPLVLLAELLAGVWLGSAKPWQAEPADPMQARFSSTAPASHDLRLPEPVGPALASAVPGGGAVLLPTAPAVGPQTTSPSPPQTREPVDPFSPR